MLAEGRLPECWVPPSLILECRALLETYHDLRAEHTGWVQRVHAVFFHQGAPLLTVTALTFPATAGIIPSALADLHERRAQGGMGTVPGAAAIAVDETVKSLLVLPAFANHPFVAELRGQHRIDYDALVGLLYLIFSYMVGNAPNQTNQWSGSTDKNAVPFMSKMTNLADAISLAAPAHLRATRIPSSLIVIINRHFKRSPYVTVAHWRDSGWGLARDWRRMPTIMPLTTFVGKVLRGTRRGALTRASTAAERTFAAPDPVPYDVSAASGGQRGVQVEYRYMYMSGLPDAAGLSDQLMKIINEVRELNTRHLGADARRDIINDANH